MRSGVRHLVVLIAALPVVLGSLPMPTPATAAPRNGACSAAPSEVYRRGGRAHLSFEAVLRDRSVRPGTDFEADRVNDLVLIVDWNAVREGQEQRIEVFTPDGGVYQRTTTALSGNGRSEVRLPVAGSWITQHSLYGAWCVQVYLDRGPAPVEQKTFVLTAPR